MSKIILRSIEKNAWSGQKRYPNCTHWIGTYYTRTGNLYTGLTLEDKERLNHAFNWDLTDNEAWHNFAIPTKTEDLILDITDPRDEMYYLFLKGHKYVKNGYSDTSKGKTDFILINEDNEAKDFVVSHKDKRDAFVALGKMSIDDMRKFLRIIGYKSDTVSNDVVEKRVIEFIESKAKTFLEKWVNNKDKENEFLIKEAISKGVIRQSKNIYKYGSDVIGRSLEDTILFLQDKANSEIKLAILNAIKIK